MATLANDQMIADAEADKRLASSIDEVDEEAVTNENPESYRPQITTEIMQEVFALLADFKEKTRYHTSIESRRDRGEEFLLSSSD